MISSAWRGITDTHSYNCIPATIDVVRDVEMQELEVKCVDRERRSEQKECTYNCMHTRKEIKRTYFAVISCSLHWGALDTNNLTGGRAMSSVMLRDRGREVCYGRGGVSIQRQLAELQAKILAKQTFKLAAATLTSLMRERYASTSRCEQRQMYAAVSRVSTLLTTQFTGVDFWMVGLNLFQAAASVITQLDELMHVRACIDLARKFLRDEKQRKETGLVNAAPEPTVNLEGHTGPLLQQNAITTLIRERVMQQMDSDPPPEPEPVEEGHVAPRTCLEHPEVGTSYARSMAELSMEIQAIMNRVNYTFANRSRALAEEFLGLQEAIQATLQEIGNVPRGPPPASKDEVAKLPIVQVTEVVLTCLGEDNQCAVCREALVVNELIQEMPCKHSYHPECLKPWLEKHNSCPICRYELRTDDEDYERQKQEDGEMQEPHLQIQIGVRNYVQRKARPSAHTRSQY